MDHLNKSKEDLIAEMQEIRQKHLLLKRLYNKVLSYHKHTEKAPLAFKPNKPAELKKKEFQKEEYTTNRLVKQNEELRKLNQTKDKFFSIVAHDLKSPFNSIIGFSKILMDSAGKDDFEGTKRYSEIIHHLANSAMDLLGNLMEWSRVSTGKMEFKPSKILLKEILDSAVLLFNDVARQKNITIYQQIPAGATLFADPEMTGVVLRNLISNAIKFTYPGGKVILSAKQEAGQLIIEVADSGIGIPGEKINDLFQLDKSFTRPGTQKEKGTGLGLKLCKEFIEKQGGRIGVACSTGNGTTFFVSLPAEETPQH